MKSANLKVGLTILVGVIIFFIFILLVGSGENLFSKEYQLKIFLPGIEGLAEGNMVSLGGIKIGSVSSIDFAEKEEKAGVDITLTLLEKYAKHLTRSSVAEIKTLGILGDKYVDISFGKSGENPLKTGNYLNLKRSVTLTQLTDQVEPLLNNLTVITNDLKSVTAKFAGGEGSIFKIINSPDFANDLFSITKGLKKITVELNGGNGTLGKLLHSDSLYNSLNSFSRNADLLSKSILSGKGSAGKLLTDDSLYSNLSSLAFNLKLITHRLNEDSSLAGAMLNNKQLKLSVQDFIISLDSLTVDLKKNPDRYVHFSIF